MEMKPGDVLTSLVRFFEILLPGALLAFLILDFARRHILGPVLPAPQDEVQGWATFLFTAYLLGHFIFLIGSRIDPVYDKVRRRFKPLDQDRAYAEAKRIKQAQVGDDDKHPIVNTFQWARVNLQLRSPSAAADLHRLESDSKFFRSLIVVLTICAVVLAARGLAWQAAGCLVLALLSFLRYSDQRWKAARTAYFYLIAMSKIPDTGTNSGYSE